jgi:hypothetical protein
MKLRIALFVAGAFAAVSAQAQSVEVTWARQPDTPLRVVRIVSTLANPIHEIAVKSASNKDIESYRLGWVPVVPPGCGAAVKASVQVLPVVQGPVWPGFGESAHTYELDRSQILELAQVGSRKIVVEVGVVKVELSDGWWTASPDDLPDPAEVQRFACAPDTVARKQKDLRKLPPELIGTWDYATMIALKNGKPFGTVNLRPGQWTVTFNLDATWVMKPPSPPANPSGLSGSYAVHGQDVDMKLANGSPYHKFRFTIEQDGKVLSLAAKDSTISASREQ